MTIPKSTLLDDASVPRWTVASALFGGVVWNAAPLLPVSRPLSFGSLDHVFLFLPLVAAPLALALIAQLLEMRRASMTVYRGAQRLQPVAAVLLAVSFLLGHGPLAALLATPWLLVALMVALAGITTAKPPSLPRLSSACLLAAFVFFPIGAVWLLLSRLGVGPRNFAAITVMLAAVHFHFSGFALQVLIAATARELVGCSRSVGTTLRGIAMSAIAGIPLIALGNILSSPALKFVGVLAMLVSVLFLAAMSMKLALARTSTPAAFLFVAAASVAVGMLAAGLYGVGELTGAGWISVKRMATFHGLLNAVGFTLCGLLAHLQLRSPHQGSIA